MNNLQNFHVLKIYYIGPTDYLGSRVKIKSERFKCSVTIDYDHRYNGICDIAQNWLQGKGFDLIGKAEGKDCYYIISNTFQPLKK